MMPPQVGGNCQCCNVADLSTSKEFTPPDLSPHTDFCRSVSSAFNLRRRWSANNRQGKQTFYLSFHLSCVWHLDKGWVHWVLIDVAGEVPGPASSSTSPFPWPPSIPNQSSPLPSHASSTSATHTASTSLSSSASSLTTSASNSASPASLGQLLGLVRWYHCRCSLRLGLGMS